MDQLQISRQHRKHALKWLCVLFAGGVLILVLLKLLGFFTLVTPSRNNIKAEIAIQHLELSISSFKEDHQSIPFEDDFSDDSELLT